VGWRAWQLRHGAHQYRGDDADQTARHRQMFDYLIRVVHFVLDVALTVLYVALNVLYVALTFLYVALTVLCVALTVLYVALTVLYVQLRHGAHQYRGDDADQAARHRQMFQYFSGRFAPQPYPLTPAPCTLNPNP